VRPLVPVSWTPACAPGRGFAGANRHQAMPAAVPRGPVSSFPPVPMATAVTSR
jgi:hypothetical protein